MLSGGTQRRALPSYQNEEMKIFYFPESDETHSLSRLHSQICPKSLYLMNQKYINYNCRDM